MTNKKAISLIVLVITIIVMIILAGAIILTLSNNRIIGRANEAVNATNLAQIQSMAQLAWADAYLDGKTTQEELYDAVMDNLNSNVDKEILNQYDIIVTPSGVAVTKKEEVFTGEVIHDGPTILEGATYYVGVTSNMLGNYEGATATYKAGDNFPETATPGDVYVYGDYEYRYDMTCGIKGEEGYEWDLLEGMGWTVHALNTTKTTYGGFVQSINGEPIRSVAYMFSNCESLTTVSSDFVIPDAALDITGLFYGCTSLTILPENFAISEEIVVWASLFEGCSSLRELPKSLVIPEGVIDISYMLYGCESLTAIPELPSTLITMNGTFANCKAITSLPEDFALPSGVQSMNGLFEGCIFTKLPDNFVLPSGATDVTGMFWDCVLLESLPTNFTIPSSVEYMESMFNGCTSLKSIPEGVVIPSGVTSIGDLFAGCSSLTGLPATFKVPSGIDNMYRTFENCTSLTGTITIDANPTEYEYCFFLYEEGENITLTGNSSILNELAGTSDSEYRTITVN